MQTSFAEVDANTFANHENHIRQRLTGGFADCRNNPGRKLFLLFISSAISHVTSDD
jgi:hypothetical protein